jgi:hypothetical protein
VLSKGASEGKEPGNETTLTLEFISCFLWQPFVAFLLVREEREYASESDFDGTHHDSSG